MKQCLNCGETAENDVRECSSCGRSFAYYKPVGDQSGVSMTAGPASGPQQGSAGPVAPLDRPDGSIPKGLGIALMLLGVVLAIWASFMDVTNYSYLTSGTTIDAEKLAAKAVLMLLGEGCFALGLILWLAGYIVYAISFLPGRNDA